MQEFKKGNSLYIISDRSSPDKKYMIECNEDDGFNPKNNVENKLFEKKVLYPNMRLDFLLYTKDCKIIKKCLDIKYRKNYMIGWVFHIDLEEIIESIETLFEFLHLDLDDE
jgi:hypothetical protein